MILLFSLFSLGFIYAFKSFYLKPIIVKRVNRLYYNKLNDDNERNNLWDLDPNHPHFNISYYEWVKSLFLNDNITFDYTDIKEYPDYDDCGFNEILLEEFEKNKKEFK